ncbi:MAG: phospho-N-acetylmuramoyl-pentapeptide-transferase [Puniceicoccales bacterium]|jgi:phospho-N-acetylmuramoyl-pentapeptide-transferase|nr:phospho-N-acetylmuramoyl-pentapeptide-transferase [Puniceicoccales bacterium]
MDLNFRIFFAFFLTSSIGFILMPFFIGYLNRHSIVQYFRGKEEVRGLADLHASKSHTPTFGGIVFIATSIFVTILLAPMNLPLGVALFVFVGFAILGFLDDFIKVHGHNSRGIPARVKLLLQALLCLGSLLLIAHFDSQYFSELHNLRVPLLQRPLISNLSNVSLFIFLFLVLAGAGNGVNLSDGLDGLATLCSLSSLVALVAICVGTATVSFATAKHIPHIPEAKSLAICLAAVGGSLLPFLWHNAHPAKIFMGDTGSLAVGGLLGIVSFLLMEPFLLVAIGGVFVAESLSVIFQVYYYKLSDGKRIFRMAPLHHHFELGGWKESQIVMRFFIASMLCAMVGLGLFFF